MIAQIFIPTAELIIPTGIATYEANAEIEPQQVTVKAKISKCSILNTFLHLHLNLNTCMPFYTFHSLNYCFISSKRSFVSSVFLNLNSRLVSSAAIFIFKILIYYFVVLFIVIW